VPITVPVDGDFWFIPADDPAHSTSGSTRPRVISSDTCGSTTAVSTGA
jgi:hypothetical protein